MSSELFARLAQPFPPERVSWRIGSMTKDRSRAQALAYIDARDVMQRLDDVVGPSGWQCRHTTIAGSIIGCEIDLLIDGRWVTKANGAGQTDIEGEKGGCSDAFKRAAVLWGIGRYLYDLDSPWVQIVDGRRIAEHEYAKLRAVLGGAKAKSAYRSNKDGDWPKLARMLGECETEDAINDFLEEQAEILATMPRNWVGRWQELVDRQRQIVAQLNDRRAA